MVQEGCQRPVSIVSRAVSNYNPIGEGASS